MEGPTEDNPQSPEPSPRTQASSSPLPRAFLRGQVDLLEQLAQGADPEEVLRGLIELAESLLDETQGSVMRHLPDSGTLTVVAAPTLPSPYVEAIDGLPVGPDVGSCGTAAWRGEDVITEDIEQDDRWTDHRDLGLAHDLRSCWSFPIESSRGQILGTFALYQPNPGPPSEVEHRILMESSRLAGTILERTRREEARPETHQRPLDLLEEASVGVYRTTPSGDLLYANSTLIEMLGAESLDDLQSYNVRSWYTDENERSVFKSEMADLGTVEQRETRLRRIDGDPIDILESARAVRDEAGDIQYYEGIIQDITERKSAQRALRDREKKLRAIIENVQSILFMIDQDGTFLLSEGADLTSIGLEPGEAVGQSVYEMYEDYPEVLKQIDRVLEGKTVSFRTEVEGRIFDVWCTPYYDEEGNVAACIGMSTDVTEHQRAQAQLRQAKNFYKQVLDQLPMEMAVFDPEARFEYVNSEGVGDPSVREWLIGRTNEEYCRHHGVDPSIGRRRDEAIRKVGRTNARDQFEETITTDEETLHYVRIHVPISDLEGEVNHVVGCGLDVTERVQYEDELRKAKEEAEAASHLKSAMLANMSHEIRTPLTSITGFAEVLKESKTDADVEELATLISRSSQRLLDTLDSMLQLSTLEAGARSLNREPVDLLEEARTVVTEQQARPDAEGMTLRVQSPSGPVTAYCDPTAVQRILTNLVGNSVKFTNPGDKIVVRVGADEGQAYLQVEDTGIGMSESFQEEMFEAFKQESAGLDREYEGSGLGLSLVKKLVEQHEGSLDVESTQGEGTTVTVYLPVYDE